MDREFLKEIEGLTDETIEKIIVEHGKTLQGEQEKVKNLTKDLKEAKETVSTLTNELEGLKESNASAEDWKAKFETLQNKIKEKEEAEKKAREDSELTSAIEAVFGDKKFTSDYVKNGIIADMKAEISKSENKGKGYAEIFESLTKDKDGNYLEGIFVNPNQAQNMAGMGNASPEISREEFNKMGYAQRNKLYRENPEMYKKLRSE